MTSTAVNIRDYKTEIPGKLEGNTWEFPTIEGLTSTKKKTFWKINVRLMRGKEFIPIADSYYDSTPIEGVNAWIRVDAWQDGGKIRDVVPTIVRAGKNIGKANQTNVFTQALRDALSLYNKQLRKYQGAVKTANSVCTELYPPMLAQIMKDHPPEISESSPVFVQRKYNGVRAMCTLDCEAGTTPEDKKFVPILYSRRRLPYPGFGYIKDELLAPLRELGLRVYIDGEAYLHGEPLQNISGYARREAQSGDKKYNYMIYDIFLADKPELLYSERKKILDDMFVRHKFQYCVNVETFECTEMKQVSALYEQFIREEYEGAMIRLDAAYVPSFNEYHSKVLLKWKQLMDHEYAVVDWETGSKGKAAEALMIICATEDGKTFPVTPALEIPERVALTKKMNNNEPNGRTWFENHLKGKMITIYFDELSSAKVPQRARTKLETRVD